LDAEEFCERSNAHLYETGRMRRVYLRGRDNILKRLLIHGAGFNLALLMRRVCGVGTPRSLQDREALLSTLVRRFWTLLAALRRATGDSLTNLLRLVDSPALHLQERTAA
jgi:hypothetical protein